MTFWQELSSWNPFTSSHSVSSVPEVGQDAPSTAELYVPHGGGKPMVVAFLRHCGCPFAEKTFKSLRTLAEENPSVHFVALSHSDQTATSHWLEAIGGPGKLEVIVDHKRDTYGAYGLGLSSFWHPLNPWSLASVVRLGRSEQIWNRPTESGSRWQTAGLFSIDRDGKVEYAHVAQAADDLGDLEKAVASLKP